MGAEMKAEQQKQNDVTDGRYEVERKKFYPPPAAFIGNSSLDQTPSHPQLQLRAIHLLDDQVSNLLKNPNIIERTRINLVENLDRVLHSVPEVKTNLAIYKPLDELREILVAGGKFAKPDSNGRETQATQNFRVAVESKAVLDVTHVHMLEDATGTGSTHNTNGVHDMLRRDFRSTR